MGIGGDGGNNCDGQAVDKWGFLAQSYIAPRQKKNSGKKS